VPVAEVGFRLAGVQTAGAMGGFYETFGQNSFKSAPNASAFMNWYSGSFHVYTDSLGFRVSEPGREAPSAAALDILVMGDSQAFGQGLEFEHTVAGQFAAIATEHGLRVGNAAVGGHFLRNQLELFMWLVREKGLRPRVVLVCLTPRSVTEPEGYSEAFVEDGQLWDVKPGRVKKVRAWLSANSAVYLTVRNALRNAEGVPARDSRGFFRMYGTGPERAAPLHDLAEVLEGFDNLAASIGASLAVAYLPLALDGEIESLAAAQSPPVAGVSGRANADASRDVSAALGTPFVDASPALEKQRRGGKAITLKSDPHYNAETSRAAAEVLYNSLDWPGLCRGNGPAPKSNSEGADDGS